jgi:hypothetical protein
MPFDPKFVNKLSGGVSKIDTQIKRLVNDPLPAFKRMIVLDVISDPQIIDEKKIEYWKNVLKVGNPRFANMMPRNSIIAQPTATGFTRVTPPMFLLPFFPSHLALPCKPGEMVWVIFEEPNANKKEMGYWLCRVAEPHLVDDVNHTHHAAQLDHSFNPGLKKRFEGKDKPIYELRNGKTQSDKSNTRFVPKESKILSVDDESIFEKLITETDASTMMHYESVPRFKKRPGDIALEGSNNTLIVLGTDRVGPIANIDLNASKPARGIVPEPTADLIGNSGAIDMVAGRGYTPTTGGQEVSTTKISDGGELKKELAKHPDALAPNEGDPDFAQDRSRVLISQRTKTDTNFGTAKYNNEKYKIADSADGDAAVVIKSDKIRIIARSDISLLVTNFEVPNGTAFKNGVADTAQWASITIRANGDIIFTPSEKGVIKLGGDDADKAILCTSMPATNTDGTIKSLPIATTAGGFVGTTGGNVDGSAVNLSGPPDLGTFSKKVVIK